MHVHSQLTTGIGTPDSNPLEELARVVSARCPRRRRERRKPAVVAGVCFVAVALVGAAGVGALGFVIGSRTVLDPREAVPPAPEAQPPRLAPIPPSLPTLQPPEFDPPLPAPVRPSPSFVSPDTPTSAHSTLEDAKPGEPKKPRVTLFGVPEP